MFPKLKSSLLLVWFSASLFAKPTLLNGTAASVGKTLITVQDVYFYRSLQRFREGESPAVLQETGDALKKAIQKVAFEEMVFQEMKSFEVENTPKIEAEKIVSQKKGKGKSKDWQEVLSRFHVTETQAVERLNRTLSVEKFLQRKVDTLTPIVTDSEIEKYYQQNQARFKGSSLEQLKPNIQVLLKKQRVQKGLEEWVRFLKEKYNLVTLLED